MSGWPATKARRVLAALLRIGWRIKRQSGSHKTLERSGWPDLVFAFHDDEELGLGCSFALRDVRDFSLRTCDIRQILIGWQPSARGARARDSSGDAIKSGRKHVSPDRP